LQFYKSIEDVAPTGLAQVVIDPTLPGVIPDLIAKWGQRHIIDEYYDLQPNHFVLGTTLKRIELPEYAGIELARWQRDLSDDVSIRGQLAGELVVHVSCRGIVREAVVLSRQHSFDARFCRWEQHHVVECSEARRRQEFVQEPGADHAVVHRVQPTACEPAGRRAGHASDDGVLIVRIDQPRIDRTRSEEPEERVALDEHARVHRPSKRLGERRLPRARRPRHNQQRTHPAIVLDDDADPANSPVQRRAVRRREGRDAEDDRHRGRFR
jgi:hypothetical protein